ncbi:unnamed protein product [Gongylonema pulchrum]|uniref:UBC core domain-containing protein n=1 Tax=Gongylonema pulchrum TaxID=637853 RepID=A0A183ECI3_9BILA|nr:unnamed protein product [Gongylonema pulchrum]
MEAHPRCPGPTKALFGQWTKIGDTRIPQEIPSGKLLQTQCNHRTGKSQCMSSIRMIPTIMDF